MSNIIEDLVNSIQLSIKTENWVAALTVALTLPDICAKVDSRHGENTGSRYASWFEQYIVKLPQSTGLGLSQYDFFSGKDCYALRCAFLHEGDMDTTGQNAQEFVDGFSFVVSESSLWSISNSYGKKANIGLNVTFFCRDICSGVKNWLAVANENEAIKLRLDRLPKIKTTLAHAV